MKQYFCRVCDARSLEFLHTFSHFPTYMGACSNQQEFDFDDMKFSICSKCGTIQLSNLIDEERVYKYPHNFAIGKTWQKHHESFYNFLQKDLRDNLKILEIGGGNCVLANLIVECNNVDYNILDKVEFKQKQEDKRISFIKKNKQHKYDAIIHSHVLEHFIHPVKEMRKLWKLLSNNGIMFVAVPNIKNMIQDGMNNALNFEHTFWLDEENIEYICKRSGFNIEEQIMYSKYAMFLKLKKVEKFCDRPIPGAHNKYIQNRKLFLKYIKQNEHLVLKINNEIENKKNVFLFGGHVFSQFLLNFGLNEKNICDIIDNDPNKHGKYLFGTNFRIYASKFLKNKNDASVIVSCAQYSKEIEEQIRQINPNIRIIK